MKQKALPDYQELTTALNQTTAKLHPSQVHGLICGILCGNPDTKAPWAEMVTGDQDPAESRPMLQALFDASEAQLKDFLFDFQLLMPSDDDVLPLRAEALTLWCQGFLTGLKLVQIQIVGRKPGEATEAINDLIEIAKMNYEDVVASEEDEEAYAELTEYVRMAVILIYQELHESSATKKLDNTSNHLH